MVSALSSRELLMFPNIPELVRLVRAVDDLASLLKVVAGKRRGGAPIITFNTFLIYLSFCQQMGVSSGQYRRYCYTECLFCANIVRVASY